MNELPQITNKTIEKIADLNSCQLVFTLDPQLSYFEGHFPDKPILAGVVQLNWAVELAQSHLDLAGHEVAAIEILKFQQLLTPNTEVTLTLVQKDAKKFTFSYQSATGNHASGRVKLI